MSRLSLLLIITACLQCVTSYKIYQKRIPNGEKVPHPCKHGHIWEGVGHFNDDGSGFRNPFGVDFHEAGEKWTKELCRKDSDGDGLSNGQELGDPNCVWTGAENEKPERSERLTHPGICDPWDSPTCFKENLTHPLYKSQKLWMDKMCKPDTFHCDAVNETGVQYIDIRLPKTEVPIMETTYICMIYNLTELEVKGDVHMVAFEPIIENSYVTHHIVLYGCESDQELYSKPYQCGMAASNKCRQIIGLWSIGLNGYCHHPQTGIRLGKQGFSIISLQLHWNNPEGRNKMTDSSGLRLYYTANKRVHDAGVMTVGADHFILPPQRPEIQIESGCSKGCMYMLTQKPFFVTMASNHMHYLGIKARLSIVRSGKILKYLADDPVYSYDTPQVHVYTEAPIEILPGDEIKLTCTYSTMSKERTTISGYYTSEEMCLSFIGYYPKENIVNPYFCVDNVGIRKCDLPCTDTLSKFWGNLVINEPVQYTRLYQDVVNTCTSSEPCSDKCVDTILGHMNSSDCLSDWVWNEIQVLLTNHANKGVSLARDLQARMQPCSEEVHSRLNSPEKSKTGSKDSASEVTAVTSLVTCVAALAIKWIYL